MQKNLNYFLFYSILMEIATNLSNFGSTNKEKHVLKHVLDMDTQTLLVCLCAL